MAITKPSPKPGGEEEFLKLLASLGGAAGGMGTGSVYMPDRTRYRPKGAEEKGRLLRGAFVSEDDAMEEFYNMPETGRRDLLSKFIMAGMLPYGAGTLEAEEQWKKLVQASSRFGQAGQKVGPYDLLAGYVKAAGGVDKAAWKQMGAFEVNVITGEKRFAGPGVYLGNGVARQTDVRTDLTDPDTAKAIATKLFQNLMGRDPGAGELGAFAKALHAAEAAAPVTQTTDTTYDMETGQPITTSTQSSGGMTSEGRALIGEGQIKKSKEYGVTQAVTTYQNAFENLIFGAPE